MNEQDFQAKLSDLMQQLDGLPSPAKEQLQQMATDTRDRHTRMKKTVGELQDSLDYLRLSIKYLVFDLEATRRENQYLRKLLDDEGIELMLRHGTWLVPTLVAPQGVIDAAAAGAGPVTADPGARRRDAHGTHRDIGLAAIPECAERAGIGSFDGRT